MEIDLIEDEVIDTSYEPFSREPQYIEANREFIQELGLTPDLSILDLACGTATMTDLMLQSLLAPEGWQERHPPTRLHVCGIDLSRESLLLAQEHLGALRLHGLNETQGATDGAHLVDLVEGSADAIPLKDRCVELVIMGNAIQLVENRDALFGEIYRVLRPGGRFAFNTSFYAGTYCEGTEQIYLRWVQEASAYLARLSARLKAEGKGPIRRRRGTAQRAFSRPWLSVEDYASELARHGLQTDAVNERTVMLDQRCFETIGAYAGLAKVLLSGYPVRLACEALERAARPALEAAGVTEVPRFWLEMVVRKAH